MKSLQVSDYPGKTSHKKASIATCGATENERVSVVAAITTNHILLRPDDITTATNTPYNTGICICQLLFVKSNGHKQFGYVWKSK